LTSYCFVLGWPFALPPYSFFPQKRLFPVASIFNAASLPLRRKDTRLRVPASSLSGGSAVLIFSSTLSLRTATQTLAVSSVRSSSLSRRYFFRFSFSLFEVDTVLFLYHLRSINATSLNVYPQSGLLPGETLIYVLFTSPPRFAPFPALWRVLPPKHNRVP